MLARCLAVLLASFPVFAFSGSSSYFSGGVGMLSTEASGDLYSSARAVYTSLDGNINYALGAKWGLRMGGTLSMGGEILALGVGATYHFLPIVWESMIVGDSATVSRYPLWVPYISGGISLVRTQLPLTRKDGSQQDIVLGGLIGPAVSAGTLFSITQTMYVNVEGSVRAAFGPNLQTGLTSITAGLALAIP